jgi:DNA topoisomerase IB
LAKLAKTKDTFLFYYIEENDKEMIKPTDINNFLNTYHSDITLKMFRTWAANYLFLEEMIKRQNELVDINNSNDSDSKNNTNTMKIINDIIKDIAIKLHNTPTVSRKSYLDNNLVQIYMDNPKLFWKRIKKTHKNDLNMLLIELLTYNCKEKTKKCKSQV